MNFPIMLKELARKFLGFWTYYFRYLPNQNKFNTNAAGLPLKPGISAVISARNEEYTISFCLKSLIGFADQVTCIDNGSDDRTLELMYQFQASHGDKIEVTILSMPGALLGDCRQAGIDNSNYQWHLRWDADMMCKYSGVNNWAEFRKRILAIKQPTAVQIPYINLVADLGHTSKSSHEIGNGEYYLLWFSQEIKYREFGKFDAIKIPFYYNRLVEKEAKIYHCGGLKSINNLIFRFYYFSWREAVNKNPNDESIKENAAFTAKYNLEYFGTNDPLSVKFRYLRQVVYHYRKIDLSKYEGYPEVLQEEIQSGRERFKVVYENGRPAWRTDSQDIEMLNYKPTAEDIAWDPVAFLRKLLSEERIEKLLKV